MAREIARLEAAVAELIAKIPRASGAAVRCACAQAHAGAAVIASADSTAVVTDTNTTAAVSKSHSRTVLHDERRTDILDRPRRARHIIICRGHVAWTIRQDFERFRDRPPTHERFACLG